MGALTLKALAAAGAVILGSPLVPAYAGGQYGDIKPGTVLRHVEHLSVSSNKGSAVSAAADGRTVAVGGSVQPTVYSSVGHVDVWVLTGAGWTLQADLASPVSGQTFDEFGLAVSLSGDGQHLAIGNPYESFAGTDSEPDGVVYAYSRTATGWSSPTTFHSPDRARFADFGSSVALNADGSELIAGAPQDGAYVGPPLGAAWAFTRTSTGWGQAQPLAPAADQPLRGLGEHVAISADGRRAVVTNSYATVDGVEVAGDVITFARASDGSWTQTSVLTDRQPVPYGRFGESVAMSADGSTIAAAAITSESMQSRVLVYRWIGNAWTRSATFRYAAGNRRHYSSFGSAVALSSTGDVVAVGAPYRTKGTVLGTGGVYRYGWSGSSWSYLGATFVRGAGVREQDGWSVALSADAGRLFIGAPGYGRPGAHPSVTGAVYVVG